jgi:hypothetical protein
MRPKKPFPRVSVVDFHPYTIKFRRLEYSVSVVLDSIGLSIGSAIPYSKRHAEALVQRVRATIFCKLFDMDGGALYTTMCATR